MLILCRADECVSCLLLNLERHSAVAPQIRPEVITKSCERAGAEKGLLTLPCAKPKHLEDG